MMSRMMIGFIEPFMYASMFVTIVAIITVFVNWVECSENSKIPSWMKQLLVFSIISTTIFSSVVGGLKASITEGNEDSKGICVEMNHE